MALYIQIYQNPSTWMYCVMQDVNHPQEYELPPRRFRELDPLKATVAAGGFVDPYRTPTAWYRTTLSDPFCSEYLQNRRGVPGGRGQWEVYKRVAVPT